MARAGPLQALPHGVQHSVVRRIDFEYPAWLLLSILLFGEVERVGVVSVERGQLLQLLALLHFIPDDIVKVLSIELNQILLRPHHDLLQLWC